jgi:hypothetical protein
MGPSRLLEIYWNTAIVTKLQTFKNAGKSAHGLLGDFADATGQS